VFLRPAVAQKVNTSLPNETDMKSIKVGDVMTTSVITLTDYMDVYTAARTLAINNISGAPVVDRQHHLLGILSDKDILVFLREFKEKMNLESPLLTLLRLPADVEMMDPEIGRAYGKIIATKVGDIMTKEVITARADESIVDVMDRMLETGVKRIPVLKKEMVIGIITRKDILWSLYKEKGD